MIKLTYLIRRRPDLSPAEFAAIWTTAHAPLVERLAAGIGALRYAASTPVGVACNECLRSTRGFAANPYDGMIEIWWKDLSSYQAGFGSPEGLRAIEDMIAIERRFMDLARSSAFLTVEDTLFDRSKAHNRKVTRKAARTPGPQVLAAE